MKWYMCVAVQILQFLHSVKLLAHNAVTEFSGVASYIAFVLKMVHKPKIAYSQNYRQKSLESPIKYMMYPVVCMW
jgi:hypothetical protein